MESLFKLGGAKKSAVKKPAAKKAAPKKAAPKKAAPKRRVAKKGGNTDEVVVSDQTKGGSSCAYDDANKASYMLLKGGNSQEGMTPSMDLSNVFNKIFPQAVASSPAVQAPSTGGGGGCGSCKTGGSKKGGGSKGGSIELAPFAAALTLLAVRAANDKQFGQKVNNVANKLMGQKQKKNKRKSKKQPKQM